MTVAPPNRRFSVSVVTRQRKHPYPCREATTCVNAPQCMASHGQNSHGCSLPFCSQQCEHMVSSVYFSGDRIVPPSILINCGVFFIIASKHAPPYRTPPWRPAWFLRLHSWLTCPCSDPEPYCMRRWLLGFPVDTPLDVSTWFEEATRLHTVTCQSSCP